LVYHIPLAKYLRIIGLSVVIILLTLIGLVFISLPVKGPSGILSFNMRQVINIALQVFAVVNPLSVMPAFLLYTEGLAEGNRRKVVNTTVLVVIALVFSFAFFGQLILNALQITVESFMLGGGVLLMVISIDMLGGTVRTKSVDMHQVAIVPLATPLLVGPGTMTTIIVLANTQSLINVLFGGLIATLAVFLFLRYSNTIASLVGKNGMLAGSRLMAIILAAVAANMVHGALIAWGIASS